MIKNERKKKEKIRGVFGFFHCLEHFDGFTSLLMMIKCHFLEKGTTSSKDFEDIHFISVSRMESIMKII
jgi:hypothetical protein